MLVVHALEVVQVDQRQRQWLPGAQCPSRFPGKRFRHAATIERSGQGIMAGYVAGFAERRFELRNAGSSSGEFGGNAIMKRWLKPVKPIAVPHCRYCRRTHHPGFLDRVATQVPPRSQASGVGQGKSIAGHCCLLGHHMSFGGSESHLTATVDGS
jgi:hypothetical protein